MNTRARRIIFSLILLATIVPQLAAAVDGDPEFIMPNRFPKRPAPCDIFTCQLPKQTLLTEQFLRDRKNGLPYTPEPRELTPFVEVLRLNQLSQTMGYINLYASTHKLVFRREAQNRVNYFLSLGENALGNGPRDGMIGYMFIEAYNQFLDNRYLTAGLEIADYCVSLPDKDMVMNGGLMCALGLGAAYKATGNTLYRDHARRVTANTAPKQFADGAFPHLPTLAGGKNIGYSIWMATELLLLGQFDAQDPNTDFMLLKTSDLTSKLIDPVGNLITQTATENYASDPGNENVGYGKDAAGLFSITLDLYATGKKDLAARVLQNGFSHRLNGVNTGGYPDVYDPTMDPIPNLWASGNPSILRTSLIFWYMTLIPRFAPTCASGPTIACATSATNCSPAMAAAGSCTPSVPGTQTCLANRYTLCLDLPKTAMQSGQACGTAHSCIQQGDEACFQTCTLYGSRICYNGICSQQCADINAYGQPEPTCSQTCVVNQYCPDEFTMQTSPATGPVGDMCRIE
jgi:hypothetical protein